MPSYSYRSWVAFWGGGEHGNHLAKMLIIDNEGMKRHVVGENMYYVLCNRLTFNTFLEMPVSCCAYIYAKTLCEG